MEGGINTTTPTLTLIGLHIYLLYKSDKTFWMSYGKFADEGNKPVGQLYNVQGDNRLSTGIIFSMSEIILLSTIEQNSQFLNIFAQFWYNKTVIAFI